jgi:hypothetical protein
VVLGNDRFKHSIEEHRTAGLNRRTKGVDRKSEHFKINQTYLWKLKSKLERPLTGNLCSLPIFCFGSRPCQNARIVDGLSDLRMAIRLLAQFAYWLRCNLFSERWCFFPTDTGSLLNRVKKRKMMVLRHHHGLHQCRHS